ncbi:MAG TPA: nitrate- and nitrite sensing domain-containing protein [Candidatus Stackebrandtia faecavium]|nr:nitrate- and nitrite sensing domain-containing protein [Candidatus Stackebrandtia faecavium]
MSKRSTTEAEAKSPRNRFGLPRLADIRIRSKLGLILIVPVVALVGIAGIRLYDSSLIALEADDTATMAEFASETSNLVHALQAERVESVIQSYKGTLSLPEEEETVKGYEAAVEESDTAKAKFEEASADLPDMSPHFDALMGQIEKSLGAELENTRSLTIADKGPSGSTAVYNGAINELTRVFQHVVDATSGTDLSSDFRAAGLMTTIDEHSERMRVYAMSEREDTAFKIETFKDFMSQKAGRSAALDELKQVQAYSTGQSPLYAARELSDPSSAATQFEEAVPQSMKTEDLEFKHAKLIDAYDERHKAASGAIAKVESQAIDGAIDNRDSQMQQVLIEIAIVLITLVVAVVLALIIARSMAHSLRLLREGALEVAHVDLPRAVAEMRDADDVGQRSPSELLRDLTNPLQLDSRDEIGTVAGAFNTVHTEAVRIAAEQAALRSSVSQMFVNLARRSQNLVDRLIGHLDRLERGEEDPDRLAELFQLDHLATRMRRNDENLLVLAGADSARVERNPAPIGDVIRAAQSEVEQYTRIEFGRINAESEVEAGAINDIVHLVAELLDNATAFSPPDSAVLAEARQDGDEVTVTITDEGIGISPDQLAELNTQLTQPSDVDISASRMMGLVVVARLAQRHELDVKLKEGQGGRGTVAVVTLPATVLTNAHVDNAEDAELDPAGPSGFDSYQPLAPMPQSSSSGGQDGMFGGPSGGFDAFSSGSNGNGQGAEVSFQSNDPGAKDRPMEVTGEIVAESTSDTGEIALPMIRLDAAPLPGKAPQAPASKDGSAPPSWPASASGTPTSEPVAATRRGVADETMELPIFREVESAWFKSSTPTPRPAPDNESVAQEEYSANMASGSRQFGDDMNSSGANDDPLPTRKPSGDQGDFKVPEPSQEADGDVTGSSLSENPDGSFDEPMSTWQTSADRGWQVAADLAEKTNEESTGAGLPKRRPMERLVPGSVESAEPESSTQSPRRDPEGVRGLLSAYHRGVQRGRGSDSR